MRPSKQRPGPNVSYAALRLVKVGHSATIKIMIYGPSADGTCVVEFNTAAGRGPGHLKTLAQSQACVPAFPVPGGVLRARARLTISERLPTRRW